MSQWEPEPGLNCFAAASPGEGVSRKASIGKLNVCQLFRWICRYFA